MMLSDFLSSLKQERSDLHEIILISFNMLDVLHAKYYNIHDMAQERYFVQTRLYTTSIYKGVDPNLNPEKQMVKPLSTPVQLHVPNESKVNSMSN